MRSQIMAHSKKYFFLFLFLLFITFLTFSFQTLAATTAKFDVDAGAEAAFSPYKTAAKIFFTIAIPIILIYLARYSAPLLKGVALFISTIIILFLWFVF